MHRLFLSIVVALGWATTATAQEVIEDHTVDAIYNHGSVVISSDDEGLKFPDEWQGEEFAQLIADVRTAVGTMIVSSGNSEGSSGDSEEDANAEDQDRQCRNLNNLTQSGISHGYRRETHGIWCVGPNDTFNSETLYTVVGRVSEDTGMNRIRVCFLAAISRKGERIDSGWGNYPLSVILGSGETEGIIYDARGLTAIPVNGSAEMRLGRCDDAELRPASNSDGRVIPADTAVSMQNQRARLYIIGYWHLVE
ncbi:hypothetical protein [Hyphobacterium sp.]|uniref:hypothetical protein n=1 Tax=Hyphobacterium sp. TaxID=2004662 RepID=UPI003BAD4387